MASNSSSVKGVKGDVGGGEKTPASAPAAGAEAAAAAEAAMAAEADDADEILSVLWALEGASSFFRCFFSALVKPEALRLFALFTPFGFPFANAIRGHRERIATRVITLMHALHRIDGGSRFALRPNIFACSLAAFGR